jgi:signal transduction histidine kinase
MLDMAKIDARDLQLDPQPVLINEVINSVCESLKESFAERKQTCSQVNLDSLPPLRADRDALRKAFYHLIVNAIK